MGGAVFTVRSITRHRVSSVPTWARHESGRYQAGAVRRLNLVKPLHPMHTARQGRPDSDCIRDRRGLTSRRGRDTHGPDRVARRIHEAMRDSAWPEPCRVSWLQVQVGVGLDPETVRHLECDSDRARSAGRGPTPHAPATSAARPHSAGGAHRDLARPPRGVNSTPWSLSPFLPERGNRALSTCNQKSDVLLETVVMHQRLL